MTITALTNADAAAISSAVRKLLQGRGEIEREEKMYAASSGNVTNGVREDYDLALSVGDKVRLYKKTAAAIEGERGFIGSNGNVVTVAGWWEKGLVLRDAAGREGYVEWRRLRDPGSGRLLLGYGHCLTVDSGQGITSGGHIDALPRGTAGITAFKAYVAESRHVDECLTLISEGAEREAELASRPLGGDTEVTEEQIWARAARNMSEKPYKALATDLVNKAYESADHMAQKMVDLSLRLRDMRARSPDLAAALRAELEERALRRTLSRRAGALRAAVERNDEVLGDFRGKLLQSLTDLRQHLVRDMLPRQREQPPPTPAPRGWTNAGVRPI